MGSIVTIRVTVRESEIGAQYVYRVDPGTGSAQVVATDFGTDTSKITTTAVKEDSHYMVETGRRVLELSHVRHSDLMILLARTTPLSAVERKPEGMSLFLVDLRRAIGKSLTVKRIAGI